MNYNVRRIAYAGLLIAISIILTRVLSGNILLGGVSILRLSFGQVPIYISGMLLGPAYGAISGALADLIGYPLNPLGPYFPGFTLSGAVSGLIPGLFSRYVKREPSWLRLLSVIALTEFTASVVLNTVWLHILTGKAVFAIAASTLISRILLVPVHATIVKFVLKYSRQLSPIMK